MRPHLVILGTTAAAVVLTAGSAVAASHHAGHAGHGRHAHHAHHATFTVVEHADTDTTTDTGATGDSVGDVLTFANPVFNKANVRQVGTDNGYCVRTVAGAAYECTWTLTLKGGSSLVVAGPFYDTKDSTLAITGGTGTYARAGGEMVLHARNAAGSEYDFTYKVR